MDESCNVILSKGKQTYTQSHMGWFPLYTFFKAGKIKLIFRNACLGGQSKNKNKLLQDSVSFPLLAQCRVLKRGKRKLRAGNIVFLKLSGVYSNVNFVTNPWAKQLCLSMYVRLYNLRKLKRERSQTPRLSNEIPGLSISNVSNGLWKI